MKLYLLSLSLLLSLFVTAQTIPHTVDLLDVQPNGEDKEILELAAFGGKLYWAVEGDVNYLSTGTVEATTAFPGGLGFRDGVIHLGDVGDLHYFYFSHRGKGYYAEADTRQPAPRVLRFPGTEYDGFTYSNPVMIGSKFYLLREEKLSGSHARVILELDPADESGHEVFGDTVLTSAHPLNGGVAALDGKIYFSHGQTGGAGPATFDVTTGVVTDLGALESTNGLDFYAAGDRLLLSYTAPDDRQVSRFMTATGGGAEHAVTVRAATAEALNTGLLAHGIDGTVYRIDYADGAATELLAGSGGQEPKFFRIDATDALFTRPDGSGNWVLGRTDGTVAGTADVTPLPSTAAGGPTEFARFGTYAALASAHHPVYLFDLDAEVLQEVNADCSRSVASPGLATVGNRLYFAAEDATKGREIHFLTVTGQPVATGIAYEDTNGNGQQDPGEEGIGNLAIDITGGEETRVYTEPSGAFHFLVEDGVSYTVTTDAPDCYSLTSSPATYSFTYSTGNPPDLSFGFQPVGNAASLRVHLNAGRVRCNTDSPYWVTVQNDGCLPLTGTATVTLPDSITLAEAAPEVSSQTGGTVTFDFGTLQPGQSYYAYLKLTMPDENSAGRAIDIVADATASTDGGTATDATVTYSTTLRCAVDPNDKQVNPSRPEPTNSNYTQLDELLTYTIRFQNTGNDTAYDVRIEDDLSAYLDLNTFHHLAGSHDYTLRMREGGRVVFHFANIYLVDSTTNPAGSQGFVSFEIRAHQHLADFTEVENTAAIYFDQNQPVITNTVVSTLVHELDKDRDGYNFYEDCDDYNAAISPKAAERTDSGMDENCDGLQATTTSTREALAGAFTVYPNPATRWLRIEHAHRSPLRAELIDATGRLVETVDFSSRTTLPTSEYAAGIYLLRVTDRATGASNQRRVVIGVR